MCRYQWPNTEWSLLEMARCIHELKTRPCPHLCSIEKVHAVFLKSTGRCHGLFPQMLKGIHERD
jgi:hypothetical protein